MRAVVLAAAIAAGCAGAPRTAPIGIGTVESGPGTVEAARKYLEGRWSLVSFEVFPPGETSVQLTGGAGSLTYDAFGNLDIQIRVDDPKTAQELVRAGVPLTNGVLATTGRTAIDLQARTLTYILEGERPLVSTASLGPLAFNRPRHWEIDGDVLTLSTRSDDGRTVSVGRWRKMP